jgi:uncharacterized membrane protein YqjE
LEFGMTAPQTQRSVPEVLNDIVDNVQMMVRAELRLARTELSQKADAATKPAIALAVSLMIGIYGCLFLLLWVVFALSNVMPLWASALIVGGTLTTVGCILAVTGATKSRRIRPIPDKTVRNLKEDIWATRHIK